MAKAINRPGAVRFSRVQAVAVGVSDWRLRVDVHAQEVKLETVQMRNVRNKIGKIRKLGNC